MTAESFFYSFRLPVPQEEAFNLFSNPRLLNELTPPWFELAPRAGLPTQLAPGVEISYQLRWRGIALPWTSLITEWQSPAFFAYEQKHGPYFYFRHEHEFVAAGDETEISDRLFFRSPASPLIDRFLVKPDLRRIFTFRGKRALDRVTQ